MVLVHSGVTDRRGWRDVAEKLNAGGRTVVTYDMRGFGDTPQAGEAFSHVNDLISLLDAQRLRHAVIVGSSLGGGVALDASLIAPERMSGLLLIAPAVSGAPKAKTLDAHTQPLVRLLEAADTAGDLAEINRLEMRIWLDGPASLEGRVSGAARDLALAMNAAALRNAAPDRAGASGLNAWERLDEVRLPTIVACGELDVPFMIERCGDLASRLPNASLRMLPGVAHLPYLEEPATVANLIIEVAGKDGGA
ncbi:MAG TPA: alpha/beta hydrolase [Candidatus Dormibacteraeota bacterium]